VGRDLAQDFLNRQSAGTGPYRIVSWQRSQRVVLRQVRRLLGRLEAAQPLRDRQHAGHPRGLDPAAHAGEGRDRHGHEVSGRGPAGLEKNPDIQVVRAQGLRILYLRIQNAAPPTSDVRVRQAINYAFDFASFQKAMEYTYDPPRGPSGAVPGRLVPQVSLHPRPGKGQGAAPGRRLQRGPEGPPDRRHPDRHPEQRKAAEILQAGLQATGWPSWTSASRSGR